MRCVSGLGLSCVVLVVVVAPAMAQAPQSPNFNRTKTVRREVTAGPARGGGATTRRPDSIRTPGPATSTGSQSSGSPRAGQPMSVQVRSTPHAFYPGMRASQGPNFNVAPTGRGKTGRAGAPMPGMTIPGGGMTMPGGMMGPVPLFSPPGR